MVCIFMMPTKIQIGHCTERWHVQARNTVALLHTDCTCRNVHSGRFAGCLPSDGRPSLQANDTNFVTQVL